LVWLPSLVLDLTGFLIMAMNAVRPDLRPIRFLRRNRVNPHLWGFQLLLMGTLLSAVIEQVHRAAVPSALPVRFGGIVGGFWILAAAWITVTPFVGRIPHGLGRLKAPRVLVPPPESGPCQWPRSYWLFLAVGGLDLLILAACSF
jgi:hypothetical protein